MKVIVRPFFSVIITTYNREILLQRAIYSLLSQKETDWECIIIDDGSSDNSELVIKKIIFETNQNAGSLSKMSFPRKRESSIDEVSWIPPYAGMTSKHIFSSTSTINKILKSDRTINNKKFNYYKIEHSGHFRAKEVGIEKSNGIYFTFLDSDDEYLPEHLSIRKEILLKNNDIDLLHGGVKIIGNHYVPDFYNPGKMIHLKECVIGGTFFIRREAYNKIGNFSKKKFGDDKDFFDKAKNFGFKIVNIEVDIKACLDVIPAKAGIHNIACTLDSHFRENDNISQFLTFSTATKINNDIYTYIYHRDNEDSICNLVERGEYNIYENE